MRSKMDTYVTSTVAAVLLVVIPYIHIGIINARIWVPNKTPVNKDKCSCSCFDTVFKGSYESPERRIGYKHIYFNATANTFKIWGMTILFIVLFYESLKLLFRLYRTSELSRPWLALYLINVYPHYYSWWSFFSYWNDDYYGIFYHHLFFTATELLSTALVVTLCDADKEVTPWKLYTIVVINAVHMVAAGFDQFIAHVLRGQGETFQRSRDVGLMIPDILHIVVATHALLKLKEQRGLEGRSLWSKTDSRFLLPLTLAGLISCWVLRYY